MGAQRVGRGRLTPFPGPSMMLGQRAVAQDPGREHIPRPPPGNPGRPAPRVNPQSGLTTQPHDDRGRYRGAKRRGPPPHIASLRVSRRPAAGAPPRTLASVQTFGRRCSSASAKEGERKSGVLVALARVGEGVPVGGGLLGSRAWLVRPFGRRRSSAQHTWRLWRGDEEGRGAVDRGGERPSGRRDLRSSTVGGSGDEQRWGWGCMSWAPPPPPPPPGQRRRCRWG
jgi:hypothetical protein